MKVSEIRNIIITGNYLINEGMVEPMDWKEYALKIEQNLVKNNGVLRSVSGSACDKGFRLGYTCPFNYSKCEGCQHYR